MSATPLVKICGLSTPETLACAVEAGADMIGLVFFPPSPRSITPAQGAALRAPLGPKTSCVALVVDASDDQIAEIIAQVRPDLIQLHGRETAERAQFIRNRFGRPIIKAVGISEKADLAAVRAYEDCCDWILLDAKPPKGAVLPGGNGLAFDWRVLEGFSSPRPWLLSGGLTPKNVAEAVRLTHAPAVDVSSGVESRAGVKDMARIRHFIAAAKGLQDPLGHADKTA